jgi:hypothetical protein
MTRYKERKAKYRSSYYRNIDITRNVPLQYEGFGGGGRGRRTLLPSAIDTGVWEHQVRLPQTISKEQMDESRGVEEK